MKSATNTEVVGDGMHVVGRVGTLEVVALGRKMGLPLACMVDVLNRGSARNYTTQHVLPALTGSAGERISAANLLEDADRFVALGMQCGAPTPLANLARGLLQIAANRGGKAGLTSGIASFIEAMAATTFADAPREPGGPDEIERSPLPARVGYIGLGAMGAPIARRLMRHYPVHVADPRTEVAAAFAQEGAVVESDLASLGRACDVIFLCLPTSATVREVLFGAGGLAQSLGRGQVVIDQTSGDPEQTRSMADALQSLGVTLIDAPVSGGPEGAAAGTIAVMCGATNAAFERARAVLDAISSNVVLCGPTGSGHIAKLVNNAVSSIGRMVTYEGAACALKAGVPVGALAAFIDSTHPGWSRSSERILPLLPSRGAAASLYLKLMAKDLGLAGRMAMESGVPLFVSSMVRSLIETGVQRFGPMANIDEMARLYETMAALSFTQPEQT